MSSKLPKEIIRMFLTFLALAILPVLPAHGASIRTHQELIVLDPGHGGNDYGIQSPEGIRESQVTMELAKLTAAELDETFKVLLTRTAEKQPTRTAPPTRDNRVAFANRHRADLFISLHLHTRRANDTYLFFFAPTTRPAPGSWQARSKPSLSQSKQMAKLAAEHFQDFSGGNIQVRPAPAGALEGLLMPGILIEPFSISQVPSTPHDKKTFLSGYAQALARAIRNHFADLGN